MQRCSGYNSIREGMLEMKRAARVEVMHRYTQPHVNAPIIDVPVTFPAIRQSIERGSCGAKQRFPECKFSSIICWAVIVFEFVLRRGGACARGLKSGEFAGPVQLRHPYYAVSFTA
jgi:hypothetical protein